MLGFSIGPSPGPRDARVWLGQGGGPLGTAVGYRIKTGVLSYMLRLGLGGPRGQGTFYGSQLCARASGAAYGRDLSSTSSQAWESLP